MLIERTRRSCADARSCGASRAKRAGSTVVEVKGSHTVYVSKPETVAALIEKATSGVKLAA